MEHETKYAKSGDVHIAYQVIGDGPFDLVFVMGWISHLDYLWEGPSAHFLLRLASFSRLIIFDKRGTGLSDRVAELPTIEQRMDDVRAVMDAAGSERAALLGISEGAAMCAVFAATYPQRTAALVMYGAYARRRWHPDYPWAPTLEQRQAFLDAIERGWGRAEDLDTLAPGAVGNEPFRKWWAAYQQRSASPGAALALAEMNTQIDIRHVLPAIHVPTLILHRTGDLDIDVGGARHMAEHIRGARYVELPGNDHLVFAGDQEAVLGEIEQFLTGTRPVPEPDTVLATILFFEIVEAVATAARLGERAWHDLLITHEAMVREQLHHHRGRQVQITPAGFVAIFDGPARAIRCAMAIVTETRDMGLSVRAGLHTGDWPLAGSNASGMASEITARVLASASPGEVVVSSTVTDLVAGSGLTFEPLGRRPITIGSRRIDLFRVTSDPHLSQGTTRVGSTSLQVDMPLSPREVEVATLIGRGFTNRQIADHLSISIATVERHVSNIFIKLGFHSRTQVALWAADQGGPMTDPA